MWTGTKFCKLKAYILSKNVTPEFLQLEHCCCLSHQFSCHVCCGTIFDNNLTSVLHCSDKMITDITLLRSLSIYDLERLVHTAHLNNWVRSKPSYSAADSAMYSAARWQRHRWMFLRLSGNKTAGFVQIETVPMHWYFACYVSLTPSQHHYNQSKLGHRHISSNISHSGECPSSTLKHVSL